MEGLESLQGIIAGSPWAAVAIFVWRYGNKRITEKEAEKDAICKEYIQFLKDQIKDKP